MSRTSDRHVRVLDHVRFHGVLIELSKLWAGMPMRGDTHDGPHEWQYIDGWDEAVREYAINLWHCFPIGERQGARWR